MNAIRYAARTSEQLRNRELQATSVGAWATSLVAVYETDPDVLPRPLEPGPEPLVRVNITTVRMGGTWEFGAGWFGVQARHGDVIGEYPLFMPMTTEQATVGGRETFGEPKKLAQIEFEWSHDSVAATVTRHGVPYLELRGRRGPGRSPGRLTEYAYCYKCLPALEKGKGLEFDPLLVRLTWETELTAVADVAGEVILRESMLDPVADLPVRRVISMTYEEGRSRSSGTVLTSVPGASLLPYLHQRYDDITPMLAALAPAEARDAQAGA